MGMTQVLSIVHQRVREALSVVPVHRAESAASDSAERNPKGDVCQAFDLVADALIHEELKTLCPNGIVFSEERVDETVFGNQPARYRFVVAMPIPGFSREERTRVCSSRRQSCIISASFASDEPGQGLPCLCVPHLTWRMLHHVGRSRFQRAPEPAVES